MNRIRENLPPDRIYGFGPNAYKESVTQLECYKALLVFPTRLRTHMPRWISQSFPSLCSSSVYPGEVMLDNKMLSIEQSLHDGGRGNLPFWEAISESRCGCLYLNTFDWTSVFT
jgi:hypothetical protein